MLQRFVSSFDETGNTDAHLKMSSLDAVLMAAASWNDLIPSTIQNCFKHAGLVRQESEEQSLPSDEKNEVWNLF